MTVDNGLAQRRQRDRNLDRGTGLVSALVRQLLIDHRQDPTRVGIGHDHRAVQPAQRAHRGIAGDQIVPFKGIALGGYGIVGNPPRTRGYGSSLPGGLFHRGGRRLGGHNRGLAVAVAALETALRTAFFLELFALLGCLPGCVVIAPSEKGAATRASAVRDRTITWRLRYKLTLLLHGFAG